MKIPSASIIEAINNKKHEEICSICAFIHRLSSLRPRQPNNDNGNEEQVPLFNWIMIKGWCVSFLCENNEDAARKNASAVQGLHNRDYATLLCLLISDHFQDYANEDKTFC